MLVVDLHTLKAVNLLNFIDNVFLNLDRAKDVEDVGRGDCTVGKPHSGLHIVVLLHQDLFCKRNEISLLDSGLVPDDDFPVSSLDLAHNDFSVDFGDNRRV